jgi:hypothetical protein
MAIIRPFSPEWPAAASQQFYDAAPVNETGKVAIETFSPLPKARRICKLLEYGSALFSAVEQLSEHSRVCRR